MPTEAFIKMGKAKASLVIEQPFLAAIVCGMRMIEDDSLSPPTLATDGNDIWFHPQWVLDHTVKQCMWAAGHETLHCVFKHMLNRGDRDPRKWNMAADYVINQLLESDMPKQRPDGVLFDPDLYKRGGGTTEGVYALLPDPPESPSSGGGEPGPFDQVRDMPGDASVRAEAEAMWKVKVAQAASIAKMAGKLSSDMERLVGEIIDPKVPWADVLRRFCLRQTRTDRSFSRPSRRHLHQGLYMPGVSGVGMGDILVAVDCSGSIGKKELAEFTAEMRGIKEDACPYNMHVIYFAESVSKYDVFGADEELEIIPGRTGGTAFSPIFRYAEKEGIAPDCCVVLTDLYCDDFGKHPDYPVLWVSNGSRTAPWGEVIMMEKR